MSNTLKLTKVVLNGNIVDVTIADGRYAKISPDLSTETASENLDCNGNYALLPAFYDTHTHSPMTLLRGYADDLELFDWLQNHIWPMEATLTPHEVRVGSQLAILEMLRSGIVCCNDSYWFADEMARAAAEMGVRAVVGLFSCGESDNGRTGFQKLHAMAGSLPSRVILNYSPHSVYTQNPEQLKTAAQRAADEGLGIQIHACETQKEVDDCKKQYGMPPVALLDKCGILGPKTVLAHCVHLDDADRRLIRDSRSAIAHCPVSNAKLCSGMFDLESAQNCGCRLSLGTDGCASNNSLNMFDEMKAAALIAKIRTGKPTSAPATFIYEMATRLGAEALGLDAGVIAPGKLADGMLIDLSHPVLSAGYNLISDLVYAGEPSMVDTVICDGKIVLRHGHFPGEEEILSQVRQVCRRIKG